MKKETHSQLELFSQIKDYNMTKAQRYNNPFFSYIRIYEKVILTIIAFITSSIISFSLGVEKGKKLTFEHKTIQKEVITPKIPQPTIEEKPSLNNYTIQVASYKNKLQAQKEIELLRKKGLSTLTLSKSGYIVLCVGNFSKKETAQSLLSELKKRYQDCFIRRL